MSQFATKQRRITITAAMIAAALVFLVSGAARAQQVVALVDGQPVTELDVQQRTKLMQMGSNKVPQRQDVLNSLIDEILEIREAKKYSIDVPESEVDNSFSNIAKHMGSDSQKMTEELSKAGTSADTLRQRLRAELAWSALVRGRYKASLEIPDTDVEAELQLHKSNDKANDVGYEYIMRPIVLVVPQGSPDGSYEARKRDADALRARFQDCTAGIDFARALPEVAVREQVVKFSADLPPELRDILDRTDVGHLTPPEQTSEGIEMFALCSKKDTSDTPEKKEIRDQLFQKKFGAQAKRYLAELRREAMIEYK
jgi:peptidyl-prolyl cis-trans isomerase SurA